jgi:uncharacterized damage-inducible protein DinB
MVVDRTPLQPPPAEADRFEGCEREPPGLEERALTAPDDNGFHTRMIGHRTHVVKQRWQQTRRRRPTSLPGGRLSGVTKSEPKAILHRYLQSSRDALVWKLDGLSAYDIRRPLTPTGTNLLGLVKHVASVELTYFGEVFGRPFDEPSSWFAEDAQPNADMWATADETRSQIIGLYHRAWAHSDGTIEMLALEAVGRVPWWPDDRSEVTLQQILVHVIAETARHAGHADIVRELVDGAAGLRADNDNLAAGDGAWWAEYRRRLERVAREAGEE